MKRITLYGAGGHGFAALALIQSIGTYTPTNLYDDDPKHEKMLGIAVSGISGEDIFEEAVCISIGNNKIRKEKYGRLIGHQFPSFIHQTASVYDSVNVGKGTLVLPNAVLDAAVSLGNFCIVNNNATVSHNCEIGDYCHIAINAAVAGGVSVGEGTLVGAGSVILPEITIGKWATIGAGAVVTKDVPDGATVYGNPAKVMNKIKTK